MKSFAFLAVLAVADSSDFPSDDPLHADCHVNATFNGISCDSLYALMDAEIRSWDSASTSPAQGVYSIYEEQVDSYIWSTRLTKNGMYTDDQMFTFTSTDTGCDGAGHSRSQSKSIYDYSVNFCNLWNVYNGTGDAFTYTLGDCAYPASDPATTCAIY